MYPIGIRKKQLTLLRRRIADAIKKEPHLPSCIFAERFGVSTRAIRRIAGAVGVRLPFRQQS